MQTNEDQLSEEVQTDEIVMKNKWTQKPPNIAMHKGMLPSPADYLGVGSDDQETDETPILMADTFVSDSVRLSKFLNSSAQVRYKFIVISSISRIEDINIVVIIFMLLI